MNPSLFRRLLLCCSSAAFFTTGVVGTGRLDALQPPANRGVAEATSGVAPQRAATLAQLAQVLGRLPSPADRAPLDVQVQSDTSVDSLRHKRLSFQAGESRRLEADLLLPRDAAHPRLPGIVFVLDDPDDRISRQFAERLVRNGFVCLFPRWKADTAADGGPVTVANVSQVIGAVDLLQSLPEVDPDRIGLIGNGTGGRLAPLIAALDDRIVATVARIEPAEENGALSIAHVSPEASGGAAEVVEVTAPQLLAAIAPRALMLRCSFTAGDPRALQTAVASASADTTAVADNLTLVDIDLHKGNQSDAAGELFQWLNHHLAARTE